MTNTLKQGRFASLAEKLDKFFLVFLFINPFLDILNGIIIFVFQKGLEGSDMPVTFSLVVRMCFLLVMGLYLLMRWDWKGLMTVVPAGAAALLSIVSVYFFSQQYNTFIDFQYAARFLFNLLAMAVYSAALLQNGNITRQEAMRRLENAFVFSGIAYSVTILLSFLTGLGLFTYETRFGLNGTRAFFFSGNEITAGLIICLAFSFKKFLQVHFTEYRRIKNWFYLIAPGLIASALILIGTKTSFLGLVLFIGAYLLYSVIELFRRNRGYILRFGASVLSIIAFFGLLQLVSGSKLADSLGDTITQYKEQLDKYGIEDDFYKKHIEENTGKTYQEYIDGTNKTLNFLLSGREFFLKETAQKWASGSPFGWFFGTGRSAFAHTIEMDIFEVFFYYGAIGFLLMLWPYARRIFRAAAKFLRKWDLPGFASMSAIVVVSGYLIMAGHVLFTVTAGFYFALAIVYACLNYGVLLPGGARSEDDLPIKK